jgi:glutathionylspermidine synthase
VHFAVSDGHLEDEATVRYLLDTAMQAGLRGHDLAIDMLGFDPRVGDFVDDVDGPVTHLFKLYPWEWMWDEPFAMHLASSAVRFVEPPWKLLLSSKAMLPLLWRRHRGHPNLLPASFDDDLGRPVVRKPRYSREGANVAILDAAGEVLATEGPYAGPCIFQASALLPCFDGRYPVVGAWVVGDGAAGMGIREDAGPITRDSSRFIPHYFEAAP